MLEKGSGFLLSVCEDDDGDEDEEEEDHTSLWKDEAGISLQHTRGARLQAIELAIVLLEPSK